MIDLAKTATDIAKAPERMATRLIILLALVLATIGAGFLIYRAGAHAGQLEERNEWQNLEEARRLGALDLAMAHSREITELQKKYNTINRTLEENYETEIANLHRDRDADRAAADRAGGLRIAAPACPTGGAGTGTEAAGVGQRDETPAATVRLPQQIEDDLWAAANLADEVTETARACQAWIRANGFYGPVPASEIVSDGNVPAVK